MRAWTNRTELPSDRRFDNTTSNHSEVMSEHDKRIIAQVTASCTWRFAHHVSAVLGTGTAYSCRNVAIGSRFAALRPGQ